MIMTEKDLLLNIAVELRKLRFAAGYKSQPMFAEENELPPSSYQRFERPENITVKTLKKILDVHQLTLAEFFQRVYKN